MSQRPKMSWRRQITRAIEDDLRFMNSSKFMPPSKLTLTTGASGTLFEFGGQNDVHGIATIIAAPGGQPSHTRVLQYPEPCGLHSAVTVWPGCVVLIAGHRLGSIRGALYRVDTVIVASGRDQFGTAELTLLDSVENLTRRDDVTWISEWAKEIPLIVHAYRALMDKLFTFKCTKPMYLEWFRELKSDEYRGISKKMLDFVQKDQEGGNYLGIDGRSVDTENIVNSYDTLIREITAYADEICKNTNHFVWCTLAYLQVQPGEFVVHGRVLHSKYGFRDTEIHVGDRLYIFNVDSDEKAETIDDFFHRHLEEYRRALLGRYRVAKHLFAYIHRNDMLNGLGSTVSAQICRYAQCCHRQLSAQEIATIRAEEEKSDVSVKLEIPKVETPVQPAVEVTPEPVAEPEVPSFVQPEEQPATEVIDSNEPVQDELPETEHVTEEQEEQEELVLQDPVSIVFPADVQPSAEELESVSQDSELPCHIGLPETFDTLDQEVLENSEDEMKEVEPVVSQQPEQDLLAEEPATEELPVNEEVEEVAKSESGFDIENGIDLAVINEEKKSIWFDTSIRQLAEGVNIQSVTVKEVTVMDRASEQRIDSTHPDYSAVIFEVNDTFTVVANAPGHLYVGKAIVTIKGSQK